jgi:glycosyltransferase involved in cell wall biosynthesis
LNYVPITMVTVCRNAGATIAGTIESVQGQQYSALEYIVIEGASTDSTPDIVRSFGNMIDVFVSEPDSGIVDAFNKGISRASGEIIGLINADDELLPGTLNKVSEFFSRHQDIDVVHGDVFLCKGEQVVKRVRPSGCWWYPWRLVLFNHPATFVRRSVYEKYGLFDTSYQIAMDVEIFLRWLTSGVRIKYLPEVLVTMKYGGVSSRCAEEGFREARRAFLYYEFSPFLVNLQFAGKRLINRILTIGSK